MLANADNHVDAKVTRSMAHLARSASHELRPDQRRSWQSIRSRTAVMPGLSGVFQDITRCLPEVFADIQLTSR